MSDLVNNEAIFSGPVLITIVGDQEAGRQYEQEARALLAQVLTTNGVNERIAAGDPGGFYFGTRFTEDGTRIVAETNNGLNAIDIFPSVIKQLDVVRERVIEEEEELLPCARAGVRYYEVGTDLRDPQDAVNFVGTFPNVVQPDPESFYGVDTRYPWNDPYTGARVPGTVYNGGSYEAVNSINFKFGTGTTTLNPCWYQGPINQVGYGFAFDCSYGNISVSLPASPGTIYTPEHTIQLVAAGKFGFSFEDAAFNTRVRIVNNDSDFSVSSNLTFPQDGLAEIGWPMMIPTATKKTQVPIRVVKNGEVFGAPPFQLDQKDIEYETSPDTYTGARTPPPTAFRFSNDLLDEADATDWSDNRAIFFSDKDDMTHVTQYGKWKIDNDDGQIKSVPYDEDKDEQAATWTIVGDDPDASYAPAILAHDLALDCIVGIALRTNADGDAFIFFVVDTESNVANDLVALDINLSDFLPATDLELNPRLVKSMLAGEGVAVVSFGSTFEERGIGANRLAVIEYCDPADKGTINTVQITKDYVDGALINTARLPIQK